MTVYTPTSERQAPATTHRQMWALGDYAAIAEELLAPLGPILVSTSGIRPVFAAAIACLTWPRARATYRSRQPWQVPTSLPAT